MLRPAPGMEETTIFSLSEHTQWDRQGQTMTGQEEVWR